ncbi:MAG: hypothetical protein AAF530_12655 [Pseudomonadota bacterium]
MRQNRNGMGVTVAGPLVLALFVLALGTGPLGVSFQQARAQNLEAPVELTMPDGRAVVLYPDRTWEFKRPAATLKQDTVSVDELVTQPSKYKGEKVVVTGNIFRLLGAYRLQTPDGKNNIVVDVKDVRRADQIKLRDFFKEGGFTSSIKAQITGTVETGTVTNRFKASEILFIE